MPRAPLAITMGDPAGIGPEIVVRVIADDPSVVVFGSAAVMTAAVKALGLGLSVMRVAKVADARPASNLMHVVETMSLPGLPKPGRIDAECGKAAYSAIRQAAAAALAGELAGIVTAPIHKEALAAAGIRHPGHTEILADLSGAQDVSMMLANEELRTVLVTIHCSLRDAIDHADFDAQLRAIRAAHDGARAFGVACPRVAVAGLNPHAGEDGLFGREEIEIIRPAIEAARRERIDATGPWPGDTVFMQARAGRFDVVVAQYHDQGLIPVKYLGLEKGVNITLGLPFVRTSPDHGTAFDIAGKGIADPSSLRAALDCARQLVEAREKTTRQERTK